MRVELEELRLFVSQLEEAELEKLRLVVGVRLVLVGSLMELIVDLEMSAVELALMVFVCSNLRLVVLD
jgi:ABC-type bacteriocin/lantibiotic exporter with double-glycine peptidase domain